MHFGLLVDKASVMDANFNNFYNGFISKVGKGEVSQGDNIDKKRLFEVLDLRRDNMASNTPEIDGGDSNLTFSTGPL